MNYKHIFLSHILDYHTPTYGDRNIFFREQRSSISKGDVANDSFISTTVHIGTHVDMPYHFFDDGQTIENYPVDFWIFSVPCIIEVEPKNTVMYQEIIDMIELLQVPNNIDILIVKTGIEQKRTEEEFWAKNPGLSPALVDYLRSKFSKLRMIGFDSISVLSFEERMVGREAHKRFLDPSKPILLLEDMHLEMISDKTKIVELTVAPLRIACCDGLPCTVIAKIEE